MFKVTKKMVAITIVVVLAGIAAAQYAVVKYHKNNDPVVYNSRVTIRLTQAEVNQIGATAEAFERAEYTVDYRNLPSTHPANKYMDDERKKVMEPRYQEALIADKEHKQTVRVDGYKQGQIVVVDNDKVTVVSTVDATATRDNDVFKVTYQDKEIMKNINGTWLVDGTNGKIVRQQRVSKN